MQTSTEDHKMDEPDVFKQTGAKLSSEQHISMDFPFDLNNLFSMQYSFDVLKQAIEFLARQHNMMRGDINNIKNTSRNSDPGAATQPSFDGASTAPEVTLNMYNQLKDLVKQNQDQTKVNTDDIAALKGDNNKLKERMGDAETAIDFLKKLGAPSGGDGGAGLLDALNDMTDKLRKEFNEKLQEQKDGLEGQMGEMNDNLLKRLQALEEQTKEVDDDEQRQIDELKDRMDKNDLSVEGLQNGFAGLEKDKCNQNDFEAETAEIRDLIAKLGSGEKVEVARKASPKASIQQAKSGPWEQITQEDIDRWNDAAKKASGLAIIVEKSQKDFLSLEELVRKLQNLCEGYATKEDLKKLELSHQNLAGKVDHLSDAQNTLRSDLDKLADAFAKFDSPSRGEFDLLKSRVDALENQLAMFKKQIDMLLLKMKGMKSGPGAGTGGADQGQVDAIIDELKKLRAEFEAHRDQVLPNLNDLNTTMPTKADKSDLEDLENRLMEQMRDAIAQLLAQIPNKDEIMKRFALLNKKIRDIMEKLDLQGGRGTEDDAMFTKKPYGPVACASCEKGLINIQGMAVDYHVWNRLPFREQGERLSKYGAGFSHILSNMRNSIEYDNNGQSQMTAPETNDQAYNDKVSKTHASGFVKYKKNQRGGSTIERNQYNAGHNIVQSVDDSFIQQDGYSKQQSQSPLKPGGARFGGLINGGQGVPNAGSTDTLPNVNPNGSKQRFVRQ